MSRESRQPLDERPSAYLVWESQFRELEGVLLTVVDASFSDKQQREAVKSIVRRGMYSWLRDCPELESQGLDSPDFKIK